MTKTAFGQIGLRIFKQATPLAIAAVCLWVVWGRIEDQDFATLLQAWRGISVMDWLLAALFTLLSFRAVSQYDVLAHRQYDTGLPPAQARTAGATAIALSQTLGFGLITGALARWRLMGGFGPGMAALVTGFVSATFLVAMLGLVALVCLLMPVPEGVRLWAALALLSCALVPVVIFFVPCLRLRGHEIELPSLRAWLAAHGWAAVDIAMAGLALWVLIPDAARPELIAFLPVFCIALAAGLLSGTPGGLGPFELVLLAFTAVGMPSQTEVSALLVAVLGFRLVYFAIPAVLAMVRLALPRDKVDRWRDPAPPALSRAPRAETAIISQTAGRVERLGSTYAGLWSTGQALVAMFDPYDLPNALFFHQLSARAAERNRVAVIYKASTRTALQARRAGWICLHNADEAILKLENYTTQSPSRSGLRRKLRKATAAGIHVRAVRASDLAHLVTVDAEWQATHGRARGGTMGRFCLDLLARQKVFVAEVKGAPVAFVSFHATPQEWALDIVRHGDDLPDGTMHALVHFAILRAQAARVLQVSLSAVPACPDPASPVWRELAFRAVAMSRSAGLRQFKSSFAPEWRPLYLAAPSRLALLLGAADITREVFWPARLRSMPGSDVSTFHHDSENYEVASQAAA